MRRIRHEITIPMKGGIARANGSLEVCALVAMYIIQKGVWPAAFLFGIGKVILSASDFVDLIHAISSLGER